MVAWVALGLILWLYVSVITALILAYISPMARSHRQAKRLMRLYEDAAREAQASTKVEVANGDGEA